MTTKVYSAIPDGYSGKIIEVEADSAKSLPAFNIVGMASKTVSEARERVRLAITNSGFSFPAKKVTVNLAPADQTKDGSHLDLPIALAVLALSGQLCPSLLEGKAFAGELSLDGHTRPVRGVINIVEQVRNQGFQQIYVPSANYTQAALVEGIEVIGVKTLAELVLCLCGVREASGDPIGTDSADATDTSSAGTVANVVRNTRTEISDGAEASDDTEASDSTEALSETTPPSGILLDHIRDQDIAKRALVIALAGHHHILLSGPPGAGKTMLAQAAANLLPDPTPREKLEITKMHSLITSSGVIVTRRPFRAPHHTASNAALIGGGPNVGPGEISLAHRGVLFLDELPEFTRPTIEALRQPLESRVISISRAGHRATYPADFLLIATMNPCPCGYFDSPDHDCICSAKQIEDYRNKISGPILDRIDITIGVKRPQRVTALAEQIDTNQQHITAQSLIKRALARQQRRYSNPAIYNNSLSSADIQKYIRLTPAGKQLLNRATESLKLSFRAHLKVIRVAQTIADLDDSSEIDTSHISEALALRQKI